MKKTIINVILSIFLVLFWIGILFVSAMLLLISDIFSRFGQGILIITSVLIYIMALVVPIVFRKKLTAFQSLPLTMIISAILAVIINIVILLGAKMYISEYSKEKWDKYPRLRVYMVDDLEREHQIIGMSEEEVKYLLGEPGDVPEWGQHRYEYYAGESIADPYTYDVLFENGVAVETRVWEH